jgi:hypothetical protein
MQILVKLNLVNLENEHLVYTYLEVYREVVILSSAHF